MENKFNINEIAKASRRAALSTLFGVIVIAISLLYSYFNLQKLNREVANLDQQIADKKQQIKDLEQAFRNYNANVAQKDPNLANQSLQQVVNENPQVAKSVLPLVYIQFGGGFKKEIADQLRKSLNANGFPSPATEKVDREFTNVIKYFNPEDEQLAQNIASFTKKFLTDKGCQNELPLKQISYKDKKVKKGQVEIWINMNCPP